MWVTICELWLAISFTWKKKENRKIGKMLTTIRMECHSKQSGKCGNGQLAFHDLQVIAHKHFKFPLYPLNTPDFS